MVRGSVVEQKLVLIWQVLHQLLDLGDVFVENNRPGVLAKYGLDWPSVHRSHPHVVMASISGCGANALQRASRASERARD